MRHRYTTAGRRLLFALIAPVTGWSACQRSVAGTETDNPFSEPPPPYESPTHFNPTDPGVSGCPAPIEDTGPERGATWSLLSENLLVGLERGVLRVMDVSQNTPKLVGELDVPGYVYGLIGAGTHVAVVVDEPPVLLGEAIPAPNELKTQRRLLHIDVSEPKTPRRVGAVDLEGEHWQLSIRDKSIWLMSAKLAPEEPSCQLPFTGCGWVQQTAMVVEGYHFSSDGFQILDNAIVPMTQRAWAARDGFVSAETTHDENGDVASTSLHVVRIAGEQLEVSELRGAESPMLSAAVGVEGSRLFYFSREEGATSSTLHVVDVSEEVAAALSRVPGLPPRPRYGVAFTAERVFVGNEDLSGTGTVVSLNAAGEATLSTLPPGLSMAFPLPDTEADGVSRTLAWGDLDQSGKLTVGFLNGGVLTSATRTEFAALPLSANAPLFPPSIISRDGRLAFVFHSYEENQRVSKLGLIDASSEPLTVRTQSAAAGYAKRVLLSTNKVLAPDFAGISSLDLSSVDAPEPRRTEFGYEELVARMPLGSVQASLVRRLTGDIELVLREKEEAEQARLVVPDNARWLFPIEERIGVVATREGHECEQAGGDDCDDHAVLVFDASSGLELLSQVTLPSTSFHSATGTSSFEQTWSPPLRLKNGAWVFASTERLTCVLSNECAELGVASRPLSETNVVPSTEATPPCEEGKECPEFVPPPPPDVYGMETRLTLYRLDVESIDAPQFTKLGSSTLEEPDSRFAEPRASKNSILLSRLERTQQRAVPASKARARFFLDHFTPNASQPNKPFKKRSFNIPGYAVGFGTENSILFAVEPGPSTQVAAKLHRLHIGEQGAYVESSRELAGRFGDMRIAGERAYYVRQGEDGCDDGELEVIALDEKLTVLDSVKLPGVQWSLAEYLGESLVLRGPNYGGYALFDVSRRKPKLEIYQRSAPFFGFGKR